MGTPRFNSALRLIAGALCLVGACADDTAAPGDGEPRDRDAGEPSVPLPIEHDAGPECAELAFRDADGDGWGDTSTALACIDGKLPEGYVLPAHDCDDSDATVRRTAYEDADGDGHGAVGEPRCYAAEGDIPDGLAGSVADCDDADPARHYYAPELWGDGIDSNCDEQDGSAVEDCTCGLSLFPTAGPEIPTECPEHDGAFGTERPLRARDLAQLLDSAAPLDPTPCTTAADVAFEYVLRCGGCPMEQPHLAVVNRGAEPAEAVVLSGTSLGGLWFDTPWAMALGTLAPGAHSGLITLSGFDWQPQTLTLSTSSTQCDTGNDTLDLDLARYECGFFP